MLHAIVMAGGSGTRFWPASRQRLPKQLLRLTGERTLIQATIDRLESLCPPERILVVTGQLLAETMLEQLPQLPRGAIIAEPCRRDTAPCIGLAALLVSRGDPDATMVVLPADHVISPNNVFQRSLAQAAALVDAAPGRIVTFGIRPTYPAETFGYIERGEPLSGLPASSPATFQAVRFREKPPLNLAREYCAAGTFYWNSGIFVWKARTILDALDERQPEMTARLRAIVADWDTPEHAAIFDREFSAIRPISIDFAVMEQARDVLVVEAPFAWDDVGSWQAFARLNGSDADGNTIAGKHLGVNTRGTIIRGEPDHLIVTLGLTDCIVVHTPDATFVANKHDEEAIRDVVKQLQQRGLTEYL